MNRRASIGTGSRAWRFGLGAALCWPLLSCGGGGGPTPGIPGIGFGCRAALLSAGIPVLYGK